MPPKPSPYTPESVNQRYGDPLQSSRNLALRRHFTKMAVSTAQSQLTRPLHQNTTSSVRNQQLYPSSFKPLQSFSSRSRHGALFLVSSLRADNNPVEAENRVSQAAQLQTDLELRGDAVSRDLHSLPSNNFNSLVLGRNWSSY